MRFYFENNVKSHLHDLMALSVAQQQSRRQSFGITCHYLVAFNALSYVVFLIVDVAHMSLGECPHKSECSCHCCHNLGTKDTD